MRADLAREMARVRSLLANRSTLVIGIDEVGLGPIAGPIAVAATVTNVDWSDDRVKDSKKYSDSPKATAHQKRVKALEEAIKPGVLFYCQTMLTSQQLDEMGPRDAWLRCLWVVSTKCLERYPDAVVVVDGDFTGSVPSPNSMAIPKGDSLVPAVSAASVVAKVARDRTMLMLDGVYPEYGFGQHKGYGTKQHMLALDEYGPCPVHRRSCSPVKKAAARWQKMQQPRLATPASTSS